MAPSSENSPTRTRSWCQRGDVGVDDRLECRVVGTWNSHRFPFVDRKHHCIGGDEPAGRSRAHSITTDCRYTVCCSVDNCSHRDVIITSLDDNTGVVRIHVVTLASNCTIVEIEKTRNSKFCGVNGNAWIEHCVFVGMGSLFNPLAELGVSRNNDSCINNIITCCIFRDFEFKTHEKLRKSCIKIIEFVFFF